MTRFSNAAARWLRSLCVVGTVLAAAHPGQATAAQTAVARDITPKTVISFERWTSAVTSHAPGEVDDALLAMERMTVDEREELRAGMALFRAALAGKPAVVASAPQKQIVSLGAGFARAPGARAFAERAVMLHGDAAIMAVQHPGVVPASPQPLAVPALSGDATANQQVLERDGEIVGAATSDWNWSLARALTDLAAPPGDSTFVAAWFHATTAFLLSRGHYGEAFAHVAFAINVAPHDARILFDRGCYAELQGLPESQALLSPQDLAALRIAIRGSLLTPKSAAARAGVRTPEVENRDAERFFREALEADPDFTEARVRLARLVDARGRHEEAATLLAAPSAVANHDDGAVSFYRELFAGRVDRALGKLESAAAHFHAALDLYPNAQSALLASSQLAVLRGDVAGAVAFVNQLGARAADADLRRDPWWAYGVGAGRDADVLLRDVWARARQR